MKQVMFAVLVATLFVPAIKTAAQDTSSQQAAGSAARTPDQVVDMLAAKLNLSDDQKTQIKPIIADRQQKIAALRGDSSMRPMKKKRQLKNIFEDSDKKIKALLDDQQKKLYAELEQQMRDQARERMQGRNSGNSSSSE